MNDTILSEAKKNFFEYDCSHFAMAREDIEKYNFYMSLNISKEQEYEWRKEQLKHYYQVILDTTFERQIGIVYSKMYSHVSCIKTRESLVLMQATIEKLLDQLDELDKLMVAETVIGRKAPKCRSGLIYLSYDMNEIELSKIFANYSLHLVQGPFKDEQLIKRSKNNVNICESIIKELSLNR